MAAKKYERIRIGAPSGPEGKGVVHEEYVYTFELQLDPGAPKRTEPGLAQVYLKHMDLVKLKLHPPEDPENVERARRLARYFAEPRLLKHFSKPVDDTVIVLRVEDQDVKELDGIEPDRVDMDPKRWIEVPPAGPAHPPGFL